MRLSIVNYGTGVNVNVPAQAKREDDQIIKQVSEVIEAQNMGKGAISVAEVMHTDLVNFNNRVYKTKGLPEAVKTFYYPHATPFLMHHNDGSGGFLSNGTPNLISVGTNLMSHFFRKPVETPNGTATGYVKVGTFIRKDMKLGDNLVTDLLQSRQLLTLSIGSRVSDENCICSICGNSIYSDKCNHRPGQIYEGAKCLTEMYSPLFREYSAVYNPADINALIRRVDISDAENDPFMKEEHVVDQASSNWSINVYEWSGKVYTSAEIGKQKPTTEAVTDMENQDQETLESLKTIIAKQDQLLKQKDSELKEAKSLIKTLAKALDDKLDDEMPEQESPEGDPASNNEGCADCGDQGTSEEQPEENNNAEGNGGDDTQEGNGEGQPADTADEAPANDKGNEGNGTAATDGKKPEDQNEEQAPVNTGDAGTQESVQTPAAGGAEEQAPQRTSSGLREVLESMRAQKLGYSKNSGYQVRSILDVLTK